MNWQLPLKHRFPTLFRPRLERLERRNLLSCTVFKTGDTITIRGEHGANHIAIANIPSRVASGSPATAARPKHSLLPPHDLRAFYDKAYSAQGYSFNNTPTGIEAKELKVTYSHHNKKSLTIESKRLNTTKIVVVNEIK